jgi:Ca2+/Na+ antiporter
MKLRNWMSAAAVVCLVFGFGFAILPVISLSFYGMSTEQGGILMSRLFGGAFILIGLLAWLARNTTEPSTQRAFALAVFVGDGVGFIIALMNQLSGVVNALGWSTVALYLIFSLGFGYFLLPGKAK